MSRLPRRVFLMSVPTGCLAAAAYGIGAPVGGNRDSANTSGSLYPGFPGQNPKLVEEVVRYSHFDIDAVHELITDRPALAKASWDWGFGDWESALGAASHMGRRDMAELLITHGARPNMFTFAMFDQVDTLRAIVQANPGVQRIHGPHGITLLVHARNGKAERVIDYLESVEGAHVPQTNKPLDDEQKKVYLGAYGYGSGNDETLRIVEMRNGMLGIQRGKRAPRHLLHLGEHTFHPTGAPSVRINFRVNDSSIAEMLTVHDADLIVTARRVE